MNRLLTVVPIATCAFLAIFWLAALAVAAGLVSDDALRLWAGATMASDGEVPIGRIIAAYPTIPFLATAFMSTFAADGTPTPLILAAALFGCIAALWFVAFRRNGLSLFAAGAATVLIAFHPAMLRASVNGPADMFFALFLFVLGGAIYDLRARSSTPEVMAVGLALLALAFSHPLGAVTALAAVPFLALTVRPALVASSGLNVVIALIFPTVFALGTFAYVAWVFPGSGWTFFAAPAESLAAWSAGMARMFGDGLTGLLAVDATLATLAALAIGAPVALVALIWVRRRRPLLVPALVFVAIIATAALLAVATRLFGNPAALALAAPVLAAVVMTRLPVVRERTTLVLALLMLGWLGGIGGIVLTDPATAGNLQFAIKGHQGDQDKIDTLAAGGALAGHDGVLADTENAPTLVLGRGRAGGLSAPSSEAFALTVMFARIDARFVAVPDPHSALGGGDRLNRTFPRLYRDGLRGYRVIYRNNTWRVFAREPDGTLQKADGAKEKRADRTEAQGK